jgi:hypothetical protein
MATLTQPVLTLDATGTDTPRFAVRHYTPAEIAEMWNVSDEFVRTLFQDEPGVLVLGPQARSHKRRYTTLRIPAFVAERVHKRLSRL